jgi:hypothetical protein
MKKIYPVLLFLSFIGCKAQSPIIDRFGIEDYGIVQNAYYKDLNNFFTPYVGTWIYTNGNTTLKITLRKRLLFHVTNDIKTYYTDYLIGEYQYIENGVEKVNTLYDININYPDIYSYNLYSISPVGKNNYPKCQECAENEKRLVMHLNEPSRRHIWGGIDNNFILRHFVENGIEKLKIWFVYTGNGIQTINSMDGELTDLSTFSLPYGEYTLIKQP